MNKCQDNREWWNRSVFRDSRFMNGIVYGPGHSYLISWIHNSINYLLVLTSVNFTQDLKITFVHHRLLVSIKSLDFVHSTSVRNLPTILPFEVPVLSSTLPSRPLILLVLYILSRDHGPKTGSLWKYFLRSLWMVYPFIVFRCVTVHSIPTLRVLEENVITLVFRETFY